jgi:hypothetical protein
MMLVVEAVIEMSQEDVVVTWNGKGLAMYSKYYREGNNEIDAQYCILLLYIPCQISTY